jgi:hypothetical protein
MRYWIGERGRGSDYIDGTDGTQLRFTPGYIEYVMPGTIPPLHVITYWIALTQTDYFVAHCWGNDFDWPFHLMTYPTTSAGAIKSALQAWPAFMALLSNSAQDKPRLSEGVIIRVNDLDDGDLKWFLGSYIGNIQINDMNTGLFGERSTAVANKVLRLSGTVGVELRDTPPMNLPNLAMNIGSESEKASLQRFAKLAGKIVDKTILGGMGDLLMNYIRDEGKL